MALVEKRIGDGAQFLGLCLSLESVLNFGHSNLEFVRCLDSPVRVFPCLSLCGREGIVYGDLSPIHDIDNKRTERDFPVVRQFRIEIVSPVTKDI